MATATGTVSIYGNFPKLLGDKTINLGTDTIKVMLVNGYSFNKDTHLYKDVVNPTEASGTGYTTGGKTLTKTWTYDSATDKGVFTETTGFTEWTTSTITATGAIIYDDTPASNKPLIAYIDFGGSVPSDAGSFKITWNATAIFTIG